MIAHFSKEALRIGTETNTIRLQSQCSELIDCNNPLQQKIIITNDTKYDELCANLNNLFISNLILSKAILNQNAGILTEFVSPEEASKRSGISVNRIRRDINHGKIPIVENCKSMMVYYPNLVNYYKNNMKYKIRS